MCPHRDRRSPEVVVHAAACSAEVLRALHDERTSALTAGLTAGHDRLRAHGGALAGEISLRPGPDRAQLAGLRRALRSGHRPRRAEWAAADRLPADLADRVRQWREHLRSWLATRDRTAARLAAAHEHEVNSLRAALSRDEVRRIVRSTDPDLAAQAADWAADPAAVPAPAELHQLTRLLVDAAARPSGVRGTARWDTSGSGAPPDGPSRLRPVRLIDPRAIDALAAALVRRPELDRVTRVRLNPSALRTDGDVLQFLGERPAEPVLRVAGSAQLRSIIALLEPAPRPVHRLRAEWRAVAQQDEQVPDLLSTAGLLERFLPIAARGTGWFDELGELLGERHPLRAELDALRQALPPEEADAPTLRARFAALAGRLGARLPQQPATDLLVADEPLAALPADQWEPALADAAVARRFLAVFDGSLPLRLVLGEFVEARFGPGARVPFCLLHAAVQQERAAAQRGQPADCAAADDLRSLIAPRWVVGTAAPASKRVQQLGDLRAAAGALLDRAPDDDGTVRLPPELLAAETADRPVWSELPDSSSFRVRTWTDCGAFRLVLHSSDEHRDIASDAENVRDEPLLDYPFTSGRGQGAGRLPVRALQVEHDPVSGVLRLHHPGSDRLPALPAVCRDAPGARLYGVLGGMAGCPLPPGAADGAEPPGGAQHQLRVESGRVVLRRQAWSFSADRIPVLGGTESSAHYLVRLREWLLHNGVAERCVVAVRPDAPGSRTGRPFFADFTSPLLAAMFEREVRHGARIVLHEALPEPGVACARSTEFQLHLPGGRAPHR